MYKLQKPPSSFLFLLCLISRVLIFERIDCNSNPASRWISISRVPNRSLGHAFSGSEIRFVPFFVQQEDDEMLVPHSDFATEGPQPMEGTASYEFGFVSVSILFLFVRIELLLDQDASLLFCFALLWIEISELFLQLGFWILLLLFSSAAGGSCEYGRESASGGSTNVEIHVDDRELFEAKHQETLLWYLHCRWL